MESSADAEYLFNLKVLNVNNLEKIIMFYGLTLSLSSLVSIKLSTVRPYKGNYVRVTASINTSGLICCVTLLCLSTLLQFHANGREKTVNRMFTPRSTYVH